MLRLNRVFPARLRAFEQVKAMIDEFAGTATLGSEDRHKLTLIVEELFTNTVNHGYKGGSDAPVIITFEKDQDHVQLVYEDSAPPFDPLAAGNRTDIESTIRDRRVGGLGIFLTISLTENIDYSYADGHNRIRLRFVAANE
ncbi:MAG TPA: ATP-binding protein [Burkholderiales bacterium]